MKELKPDEKIIEAALDVVKENTISGTRMHLIAERAEMVQSNLHYYYKTKNDLMLALQKKVLSRCLDLRERYSFQAKDTLEDQIDVFIRQKLEFIRNEQKYDYAEIDFWVQGRINDEMRVAFASSFSCWREGLANILEKYAKDMSEEKKKYLPYVMVSMLEGASIQYLIDEGSFDVEKYFEFCKDIILKVVRDFK